MKLVTFSLDDSLNKKSYNSIGILIDNNEKIIDISKISHGELPNNMLEFLNNFDSNNMVLNKLLNQDNLNKYKINSNTVTFKAPLPNPRSFRDAYAFRKHVEAGRKNRGLKMIPEYDQIPVFYFSNHNSIKGPGKIYVQKKHLTKLDFEFEIALVVSKQGKNISATNAFNYIAGLVIMNDWSARELQFQEMKLNLGPAKGKDFATSIGPYIITLDELENYIIKLKNGFTYDLNMKGYINGELVSNDNMKNMSWSFSEIIERASYGVTLYPGDLIGSGTCETGCFLELNLRNNTNDWLKIGDEVELCVDSLGSLKNIISFDKNEA